MKNKKKNDKQKENWISQDEIQKVYDELKFNTKQYMTKKEQLTNRELLKVQDFVILSLFTLIPPRRCLDYVDFKINNIDTNNDNYMKGNELIFNSYETSKQKGSQKIEIPKELRSILTKYIKLINGRSDYLLFNYKFKKLQSANLTLRLNAIFGKKV